MGGLFDDIFRPGLIEGRNEMDSVLFINWCLSVLSDVRVVNIRPAILLTGRFDHILVMVVVRPFRIGFSGGWRSREDGVHDNFGIGNPLENFVDLLLQQINIAVLSPIRSEMRSHIVDSVGNVHGRWLQAFDDVQIVVHISDGLADFRQNSGAVQIAIPLESVGSGVS